MWEGIVAKDALAVALLDATNLFLDDLQEIALTLSALVPAGTLEAALDVALVAQIVL